MKYPKFPADFFFFIIEKSLIYNIINGSGVCNSDSQFQRLYSTGNYYKILAVFPVLYSMYKYIQTISLYILVAYCVHSGL